MAYGRTEGHCQICKSSELRLFYHSITTMFGDDGKPKRELVRQSYHCLRCGHYTVFETAKEQIDLALEALRPAGGSS